MPQNIKIKILKISIGVIIIIFILRASSDMDSFLKKNNISKEFIKSLIYDTNPPVKQYQGRSNIAVFGIMGGSHEGADLTDTIIFVSIDYMKKDTVIMSLPRDIWMESLKDKINTSYHYGEEKQKGGGLILAKSIVEEVTGQPIHYAMLLDLSNFEKIIDLVGGIDVNIDRIFTDNYYPIPGKENDLCDGDPKLGCRFEKLVFEKGISHMNGGMASKYIRSRQAEGEEGTDFARNHRQQQVIMALKDKISNLQLWNKPMLIKQFIALVNNSITTDMNLSEKIINAKYLMSSTNISYRRLFLDWGNPEKNIKGFLENPPVWKYNGAWVLIPRTGNFDEIHKYITCQLLDPLCTVKP